MGYDLFHQVSYLANSMPLKVMTPTDLRRHLDSQGVSLTSYAKERGVQYHLAVQLINGQTKGKRGKSHDAAIKLGLKEAA